MIKWFKKLWARSNNRVFKDFLKLNLHSKSTFVQSFRWNGRRICCGLSFDCKASAPILRKVSRMEGYRMWSTELQDRYAEVLEYNSYLQNRYLEEQHRLKEINLKYAKWESSKENKVLEIDNPKAQTNKQNLEIIFAKKSNCRFEQNNWTQYNNKSISQRHWKDARNI